MAGCFYVGYVDDECHYGDKRCCIGGVEMKKTNVYVLAGVLVSENAVRIVQILGCGVSLSVLYCVCCSHFDQRLVVDVPNAPNSSPCHPNDIHCFLQFVFSVVDDRYLHMRSCDVGHLMPHQMKGGIHERVWVCAVGLG